MRWDQLDDIFRRQLNISLKVLLTKILYPKASLFVSFEQNLAVKGDLISRHNEVNDKKKKKKHRVNVPFQSFGKITWFIHETKKNSAYERPTVMMA